MPASFRIGASAVPAHRALPTSGLPRALLFPEHSKPTACSTRGRFFKIGQRQLEGTLDQSCHTQLVGRRIDCRNTVVGDGEELVVRDDEAGEIFRVEAHRRRWRARRRRGRRRHVCKWHDASRLVPARELGMPPNSNATLAANRPCSTSLRVTFDMVGSLVQLTVFSRGRSKNARLPPQIFQDFPGGVQPGESRDAVARMRAGAAEVKPAEWACDNAPIPAAGAS